MVFVAWLEPFDQVSPSQMQGHLSMPFRVNAQGTLEPRIRGPPFGSDLLNRERGLIGETLKDHTNPFSEA